MLSGVETQRLQEFELTPLNQQIFSHKDNPKLKTSDSALAQA
ncbi:hypothetical protein COO91_04974 [Nostoc flagelliforme CCNUN1]|uniref:Uncharacterized protein n=1 Tax=Nostoc flagelliforme CCNUN1 TaxID=2038116 RepID=A0A2K8SU39_9NOSO|nr:hypothetical protein COO91_04974 [Nostoc flagelliforme CCNUN1]